MIVARQIQRRPGFDRDVAVRQKASGTAQNGQRAQLQRPARNRDIRIRGDDRREGRVHNDGPALGRRTEGGQRVGAEAQRGRGQGQGLPIRRRDGVRGCARKADGRRAQRRVARRGQRAARQGQVGAKAGAIDVQRAATDGHGAAVDRAGQRGGAGLHRGQPRAAQRARDAAVLQRLGPRDVHRHARGNLAAVLAKGAGDGQRGIAFQRAAGLDDAGHGVVIVDVDRTGARNIQRGPCSQRTASGSQRPARDIHIGRVDARRQDQLAAGHIRRPGIGLGPAGEGRRRTVHRDAAVAGDVAADIIGAAGQAQVSSVVHLDIAEEAEKVRHLLVAGNRQRDVTGQACGGRERAAIGRKGARSGAGDHARQRARVRHGNSAIGNRDHRNIIGAGQRQGAGARLVQRAVAGDRPAIAARNVVAARCQDLPGVDVNRSASPRKVAHRVRGVHVHRAAIHRQGRGIRKVGEGIQIQRVPGNAGRARHGPGVVHRAVVDKQLTGDRAVVGRRCRRRDHIPDHSAAKVDHQTAGKGHRDRRSQSARNRQSAARNIRRADSDRVPGPQHRLVDTAATVDPGGFANSIGNPSRATARPVVEREPVRRVVPPVPSPVLRLCLSAQ